MNRKQIQEDIAQNEGLHREFKEANNQLPRNLFETICAFLNTDGGTIFLGVADGGTITGVDPEAVTQMKTDLANLSNNPQKICKFMIQLGRFNQLGSGVTNINKYLPLYANGAKPVFKETHHGFELTLPLAEAQATGEVTGEVQKLLAITTGEMKRTELQAALNLRHEDHFREAYLLPSIRQELIEMTIPDKPRSSRQKYRLTEKGKQLLKTMTTTRRTK